MKYFTSIKLKKNPILCNIPHSSTAIPAKYRKDFIISDKDLKRESMRLSDLYADDFYSSLYALYGGVVSEISRLVIDMERLENDEREAMSEQGMGVLYTKTENEKIMRIIDNRKRLKYLDEIYYPYHKDLDAQVKNRLSKFGKCLILDCHSFPSIPRKYESDKEEPRPDICLGTDDFHTPDNLKKILEKNFKKEGFSVKFNSPYKGTIVPLIFYRKEKNLFSILIEVNRKLYMNEKTFLKNDNFEDISKLICEIIKKASSMFLAEKNEKK